MNGPNGFHVVGTLKDWSATDRLHRINVPVLVISGAHDEATAATVQPFLDHIPGVRGHVFPNSSHMPHVEGIRAVSPKHSGASASWPGLSQEDLAARADTSARHV